MLNRILSFGAVVAVALGALALPAQAQRTPLVVYTAMENDQLKAFKDAIEAAVPDVDIQWVRDFDRRHHRALPGRESGA